MSPERVFRREKRSKIIEEKVDRLATSRPRAMRRSSIFSLKGEKDLTAQLSVAMDDMEEEEEEKNTNGPQNAYILELGP